MTSAPGAKRVAGQRLVLVAVCLIFSAPRWSNAALGPDSTIHPEAGLAYKYYEGSWTALPDFGVLTSAYYGAVDSFSITPYNYATPPIPASSEFAFAFSGFIKVDVPGAYTFYCNSSDGSKLFIGRNDSCIVDNDGTRSNWQERAGTVDLQAGYHRIEVAYFCATSTPMLQVSWQGPGVTQKQQIPHSVLYHDYALQILAPLGPQSWHLGDTVRLSWRYLNSAFPDASHLTSWALSTDAGQSYTNPLENESMIAYGDSVASTLWIIPNDTSYCTDGQGMLKADEYNREAEIYAWSGPFTIAKTSAAIGHRVLRAATVASAVGLCRPGVRSLTLTVPAASGVTVVLARLDGSRLCRFQLEAGMRYRLTGLGSGIYLVDMSSGDRLHVLEQVVVR